MNIFQLILIILSITFLIIRIYSKQKRDFLISVLFVLLFSFYNFITVNSKFTILLFISMALSFLGDLAMANIIKITSHRSINGAIFFGLAHIMYITAFVNLFGAILPWVFLITFIIAIPIYYLIAYNPSLDKIIKLTNFVYVNLILSFFAVVLVYVVNSSPSNIFILLSILGTGLFLISDAVLSYDLFKKSVPYSKDIIAVSYVFAQLCIQFTGIL